MCIQKITQLLVLIYIFGYICNRGGRVEVNAVSYYKLTSLTNFKNPKTGIDKTFPSSTYSVVGEGEMRFNMIKTLITYYKICLPNMFHPLPPPLIQA